VDAVEKLIMTGFLCLTGSTLLAVLASVPAFGHSTSAYLNGSGENLREFFIYS
jgi:hypothetical protein